MALMESGKLSKLIGSIGKTGVKLERDIQVCAVQCIGYSIVDRNITPGQQLYEAMPKGARRDALVAYLEKNGQFAWLKAEKRFEFFDVKKITKKEITFTEEDEQRLMGMPWTGAKREPAITSVYDVDEQVTKFIGRMERLAATPGVTVAHKELLEDLKGTVAKYHFEEYRKTSTALTDEQVKEELATLPPVKVA